MATLRVPAGLALLRFPQAAFLLPGCLTATKSNLTAPALENTVLHFFPRHPAYDWLRVGIWDAGRLALSSVKQPWLPHVGRGE